MSKLSGAMLAAKLYERWLSASDENGQRALAVACLDAAAIFIEEASKRDFDTARPTHPGLPADVGEGIPHDELASTAP